jgi:hypothetical protein
MTNKIKSTSKSSRSIVSTSKRYRSIDKAQVAKSLGAEEAHEQNGDIAGSPPTLFALREELHQRLRSTGGRRRLEGASKRYKIPLLEGDWEELQKVAKASETEDVHPTPAQVASILIHGALRDNQPVNVTKIARDRKR